MFTFTDVLLTMGISSFIGGLIFRMIHRYLIGANIFDIRINLTESRKRRFRLIELIPILGTSLTILKNKKEFDDVSHQALQTEVVYMFMLPPLLYFVNSVPLKVFFLIFLVSFVFAIVYQTLVEIETTKEELEELEDKPVHKVMTRIAMINKQ